MAHIMRSRVGAETKHPMHLQCGNALLAGQHEIDDLEPSPHLDIGVFEDRSDKHREPIASLWNAFGALPVERSISHWIDVLIAAARANDALWPSTSGQILFASIVGREQLVELQNRHLLGEFDRAAVARRTAWCCIRRITTTRSNFTTCMGFI